MADDIVKKVEELVAQGTQLAPLGGFDFSGYNARLQNKYLEWRKACLEALEHVGPIGVPYKNKILADANGGYFFQASAQLILNNMKDLFEKLKASPELAAATAPAAQATAPAAAPAAATVTETAGARVIKPPPKPAAAPQAAPPQPQAQPVAAAAAQPTDGSTTASNKVYVVGEPTDPLRQQLLMFLQELGLEEIAFDREHGKMIALDQTDSKPAANYAFFVFNSDDLAYAMFELGHFVGKLGKNRVCVLHMTDVQFPKNIPGILVKPVVVKLEEATLSILKELKTAGIKVTI